MIISLKPRFFQLTCSLSSINEYYFHLADVFLPVCLYKYEHCYNCLCYRYRALTFFSFSSKIRNVFFLYSEIRKNSIYIQFFYTLYLVKYKPVYLDIWRHLFVYKKFDNKMIISHIDVCASSSPMNCSALVHFRHVYILISMLIHTHYRVRVVCLKWTSIH